MVGRSVTVLVYVWNDTMYTQNPTTADRTAFRIGAIGGKFLVVSYIKKYEEVKKTPKQKFLTKNKGIIIVH